MSLSDEALAEIRRRAEAASKGPWQYDPQGVVDIPVIVQAPYGWVICSVLMNSDFDEDITEQASKNGPFIAHAREDVPALLDEVETLRGERSAAAQLAAKRDAEHAAEIERLETLYRDAREALARQRGPELIQQEQFDRDTQAALTKARTG